MGIKLKLGIKSYEKPEKIELPYKLKYKIYDMTNEEWTKLQELTSKLKFFLDKLHKKQQEKYKKKVEGLIESKKKEKKNLKNKEIKKR